MTTSNTSTKNGDVQTSARQPAAAEKLGDANIGLESREREGSIRVMNIALANASLLTIKTKKFHWDVVGPQFMTLHKLWDDQYETLTEYADEIAERIRMLGGYPIGTAQGFLQASELKEYPGQVPNATEAVRHLLADHESIARSLRSAIELCDGQLKDAGTADFLTGMLQGHEKMAWMLRSFLLGSAVQSSGEATHGRIPNNA
jgi:starvation-inducible DNA-binding protein